MFFFELLQKITSAVVGLSIFLGIASFVLYRDAFRWRRLAERYERPWGNPILTKNGQFLTLYSAEPVPKSYRGTVSIGIESSGIALKIWRPLAWFQKPIFIPYSDIEGWNQTWYPSTRSVELRLHPLPDVKLVMPLKQVEWIREFSGNRLHYKNEKSPYGERPRIIGFFAWIYLAATVFGLLAYYGLRDHIQ